MNKSEAGVIPNRSNFIKSTSIRVSGKKITVRGLQIENELLKAQKAVNEIAMAQMSTEICELNTEIQKILDDLKDMQ